MRPYFPYVAKGSDVIIGRLSKNNEIQREDNLEGLYCPPTFEGPSSINRNIYEMSCPDLKQMHKDGKEINWEKGRRDMEQINKIAS